MAKRVCRWDGCPRLVPADAYRGLCDTHRRQWDRDRGTREQRGYGADHQAERERYAKLIRAGLTIRCVTCGQPVGLDFHLGHNDERTEWIGPQCPTCNDAAAGRASHPQGVPLSRPTQHRR